jgi:hypothetical protein
LQGIAASTLLFSWMSAAAYPQATISYWPGAMATAMIILLALLTHILATVVSHHLGRHFDERWNLHGSSLVSYRAVVLLLQAPVILLYTFSLGRQLPV